MAHRIIAFASIALFAQSLAAQELPPAPAHLAPAPLGEIHDMALDEGEIYEGMTSDDIAASLSGPADNAKAVAAIEAGDPKANMVNSVANEALKPAKSALISAGTSAAVGAAGSLGAGALAIVAAPVVIIGGAAALACVELCPTE